MIWHIILSDINNTLTRISQGRGFSCIVSVIHEIESRARTTGLINIEYQSLAITHAPLNFGICIKNSNIFLILSCYREKFFFYSHEIIYIHELQLYKRTAVSQKMIWLFGRVSLPSFLQINHIY